MGEYNVSYAIIRNTNYKMKNLAGVYRHNERKNTNYSNKDINRQNSIKNYSIKAPYSTYEKIFKNLKKQYNLKGQIKTVSNVMCELVITSDREFFKYIGENETKRYFQTAYKFVSNYKNLGEEFIVSAKVHNDESTPHLHIVFVPVVHKKDKEGKEINKIACSEYWKGKDSYKRLQDSFYNYMIKSGFELERGDTKDNKHIDIERLKKITDYETQKYKKQTEQLESTINTNNIEILKLENKRIIKKFNTLANQYIRIKNNVDTMNIVNQNMKIENDNLKEKNKRLEKENIRLKDYIDKTFEYVSLLFDFSKERLKRLVNSFIYEVKNR